MNALDWIREGLRAGVFLRPRTAGQQPLPVQLLLVVLLSVAVELGLGRLEVPGPAGFNLRGWLASWWSVGASALLVWALLRGARPAAGVPRPVGVASWFALWLGAAIPASLVAQGLAIAHARDALPALAQGEWFTWGSYFVLWIWTLAVALHLGWHFGLDQRRRLALVAGLFALFGLSAWQFPDRPWEPLRVEGPPGPMLALSQESFETQLALWNRAVDALAPQRPGVVDVYGLVFAPFALEDVFLRESTMVAGVLAQRFDAQGRVLHLVNHASTVASHPWATRLNLGRAIEALAERMDREQDLLVIYLTSHGASDFQLASAHPPLQVDTLSPSELRRALDEAGIRHRVIAVSACFSGGWIAPLASDTSLVMTAAAADRTSYGCGKLSELTFFGRAVFDEQLRRTRSFEQAFAAAVPVIRQREEEARKPDGFSDPQLSVGEQIRPLLRALEQRLDGAPFRTGP